MRWDVGLGSVSWSAVDWVRMHRVGIAVIIAVWIVNLTFGFTDVFYETVGGMAIGYLLSALRFWKVAGFRLRVWIAALIPLTVMLPCLIHNVRLLFAPESFAEWLVYFNRGEALIASLAIVAGGFCELIIGVERGDATANTGWLGSVLIVCAFVLLIGGCMYDGVCDRFAKHTGAPENSAAIASAIFMGCAIVACLLAVHLSDRKRTMQVQLA